MRVSISDRQGIPGGSLHVERKGSGPTLLMIHGFPLDSRMWANQLPLAEKCDLVIPDLRGFGQSSDLAESWSVAQFALDLEQLLDQLEIQSAIMCGLSLGGYIAFECWSRLTNRIEGLVLCNTRAVADDELTARARQWMAERVRHEGTGFVAETMLPKLMADENQTADLKPAVSDFFDDLNAESIAITQIAMSRRADFSSRLAEIKCPTLVLAGSEDVISPPAEMSGFASRIPEATFHEVPHAGHLTPIENPQVFNSILENWISDHFPVA